MAVTFGCVLTPAIFGPIASPEAVRVLAQHAEALGFDAVWLPDHLVFPRRAAPAYPYSADGTSPFDPSLPMLEPISVLNFLAGCTRRVRLGLSVLIIPYRPPMLTAKMLATLDVLSGGRLILGAGVGWMAEEFAALGLDTFAERGAVTDEYLRLFKAVWTQDNPSFEGKYASVAEIGFLPKPVQKPHPPILIGGHTEPALRRAAEIGDGWLPLALRPPSLLQPDEMEAKIARLQTLVRQAGRPDDAVTITMMAPIGFAESPTIPRPVLTGPPDAIAADLRRYQALGVQSFNLALPGGTIAAQQESMERFARDVMPLVP